MPKAKKQEYFRFTVDGKPAVGTLADLPDNVRWVGPENPDKGLYVFNRKHLPKEAKQGEN